MFPRWEKNLLSFVNLRPLQVEAKVEVVVDGKDARFTLSHFYSGPPKVKPVRPRPRKLSRLRLKTRNEKQLFSLWRALRRNVWLKSQKSVSQ